MSNASVYRTTRDRIIALVTDPGVDAEAKVPACPDWSVRNVVAHLAGVCADINKGNMAGVATDPWTSEHVRTRTERPLNDIVAEWRTASEDALTTLGEGVPDQLIFDEVTHEHDLRATLGRPTGGADGDGDEAVTIAVQFIGPILHAMLAATAPPLTIRSDHQEWSSEAAAATLTTSDFDLLRSGSGRRTRDQVAALDWGGADPTPWLDAFFFEPFHEPQQVIEATA